MSKRFGRNQKRRLVAEVARFKEQLFVEAGLREHTSWRLDKANWELGEANSVIRLVAQILGPNFVGLPAEEIRINSRDCPLTVPNPRRIPVCPLPADHVPIKELSAAVQRLEHSKFKADLDRFTDMIHFRYKSAGGDVGYSMSRDCWSRLPRSARVELACRDISMQMARYLADNPHLID